MKRTLYCLGLLFMVSVSLFAQQEEQSIWLSDLDLTKMNCAMGTPKINQSIRGEVMKLGGEQFTHGVGTHAYSRMLVDVHGTAKSFYARVGLDDGAYVHACISFYVLGDKKILWESGPVKRGDKAKEINVDLKGIHKLGLLVTVVREDISENYADWADARIVYVDKKPAATSNTVDAKQEGILTPAQPRQPRINGPAVYGVRPGSPFLYRIPVSGKRPMEFKAEQLPKGLQLDKTTGIITGTVSAKGKFPVVLIARNRFGESKKKFAIVAGDKLALTPPMGWNSWYIYYNHVSDSVMRSSADAMINSGMADYGYHYVNIDDCWMNKPGSKSAGENGSPRDASGTIMSNSRFPDMKAMTGYIHAKGLKAGVYSSPGPKTCAGYTGSYQHEVQDAQTFANWGFDFLKYDWCSYGSIAKNNTQQGLKAPFVLMGDALKKTSRDILLNLCQYGMGEVWKWGSEMGQSWRTGADLGTSTGNFLPGFYTTGLANSAHWQFAKPGAWNDPDYIMIGWVGGSGAGQGRKITLSNNEQYAYMTMWSLMASPLFFSGDMTRLDSFDLNVLCNHEVIAVNQDELGQQARIIRNDSTGMVMVKELADGSKAVGLFNFPGSKSNPADYFIWDTAGDGTRKIKLTESALELKGPFKVHDVWRQKDLGLHQNIFETAVPYHGVVFLKISQ